MIRNLFLALVFGFIFITPLKADELKDFLLKLTDSKNYPYDVLEEDFKSFFITGDQYLSLGKTELKDLYEEQNKVMADFKVDDFRILSRSDTTRLASVTYEYKWSAKVGNTDMTGVIEAHSILRKHDQGWTVIYSAVSQ